MRKYRADVVIIGGGISGLYAGYLANKLGYDAIVIRKGQGATALSSGNIDIMGYYEGQSGWFDSGAEGIRFVTKRNPTHPYSLLDMTEGVPDLTIEHGKHAIMLTDDSIKEFNTFLGNIYTGSIAKNAYIGTTLGTIKPTGYLPFYMANGDLSRHNGTKIGVVGIYGYADFDAGYCADSLKHFSKQYHFGIDEICPVTIKFKGLTEQSNLDPFNIARKLEIDEYRQKFIDDIKTALGSKEVTHLAFPPILGIDNAKVVVSDIENELGVKVFELASLPPNTQGLRLVSLMERTSGAKIQRGEVISFNSDGSKIKSVVVRDYSSKFLFEGDFFILATGKFISDGIIDTGTLKESVFGLPVFDGKVWVKHFDPLKMSERQLISPRGHRFLRIGIRVNYKMQPLNDEMNIAYENLVAAGSVIGGYDSAFELSGFGVAISTAYKAVQTLQELRG